MIIPDLDDLVLDEEGGNLEELGRAVLASGPWTTIAYLVRTRPDDESPWQGPELWLHRYQQVRGGWKLASRFRTTGPAQVRRLAKALAAWDLGPEDEC